MVARDIWKEFGKPDEIHLELAREMKMNAAERQKLTKFMREQQKQNEAFEEILKKEFQITKPTKTDIIRYRLWNDQKQRCIYTGKTIQKAQLFNGETDIDHILPRQRYFDDSFNNKVLCFRRINEDKSNKTACEYVQSKGDEFWQEFVGRINELYKEGKINKKKKYYLLTDKIPEDFINRQLNETRYISRRVKAELEKICTVVSTIGNITDYLKEDWKLNKVFKEVQLERFQAIEARIGKQLIFEIKNNGYHDYQIEGWDKRIDHRHHALDAITIACTNRSMIQQLNNLAQLHPASESLKNNITRHFPIPSPDFREQVRDILDNMIVSHKSRKRLLTYKKGWYKVFDPLTGKYIMKRQENPSPGIRGQLHDEQPLGEIKEYEKIQVKEAFQRIADNKNTLQLYLDSAFPVQWQKQKLLEKLEKYMLDPDKVLKNLRKDPVTKLNGEELNYVTILKRKYVKTRNLDTAITPNQIENIIDRKLQTEIKEHLKKYGDDVKKAFTTEGLLEFNKNRKIPVYKVRCKVDETEVGSVPTREPLERDSELNPKLHIEKGDNYCFVIHENILDKKREFDVISFFDAIALVRKGLPIISTKHGYKHFVLKHNELVYVLRPNEEFETINWEETKNLSKRIFRIVKFSNKRLYALKHNIASNVVLDESIFGKFSEFGTNKNCVEFIDSDEPRTKISERCVKVYIDRLGKIKTEI